MSHSLRDGIGNGCRLRSLSQVINSTYGFGLDAVQRIAVRRCNLGCLTIVSSAVVEVRRLIRAHVLLQFLRLSSLWYCSVKLPLFRANAS
jgi:hypothetical protein